MALLKNLLAGVRGLLRKEEVEREMDEELKEYLDSAMREKMREGMSREQAARAARIEMGGMEAVKENVREASWESRVETVWSDLRFGARLLRLNPLFAGAAILSLALGIGANTAIFQLIDAVRLRTLPVKNPQEIARVRIDHRTGASGRFNTRYPDLTYAMWEQIRAQQQGFSGIFAWGPTTFNIAPGGEVHNVQGLWVSGEFFETLGVQPALGRLFSVADDQPGCGSAGAAISYAFWQREFGGERSVLGRSITVNRHPFPIVGVAPADFYGVEVGRSFDVAVPLCAEPLVSRAERGGSPNGEDSQLKSRIGWWLSVMGRLKPGWSMERAAAQLRAISPGIFEATLPPELSAADANHFLQYKLGAFPGGSGLSDLRKDYEKPLWLLLTLAGLVLLIASANLANLMLARASAREKEMAMRMAVGAGRGRLIRQLLVESLLLAGIGAALGAVLARNLSLVLVASLSTQNDPLFVDLGTDWRVLGFTSVLAVLTCILFGLAPALRATSVAPGLALKEGGRGATQGRSRFALRRILVVSQIALSLTLLVGALLFARSLNNLAGVDAGFRRDGILVTDIDFTSLNLAKEARLPFSDALLKRVRGLSGVESAATAAVVPLSGDGIGYDILLNANAESEDDVPVAVFNVISPGYFETLQTRIVAGRDFDEHDSAASPHVTIVNETFAKKFANGTNPVGMKFRVRTMGEITPYEVIGLVQDTKYVELREDFQPIVYTAMAQSHRPGTDAQILIRSRASLASLIAALKMNVSEVNPNMDITFSTLSMTIENGLLRDRLMARLSGFFGLLAVLLAVVGLYGVISYMVARRRNEIAIRVALGAGRESIVSLVMREAGVLLTIGLMIGMGLALVGGKAAASMLFGLKPWDVGTFVMALLLLATVAVLASLLPAARAARSDPMDALRQE
jgi:putative ABC transport system permease protein